MAVEHRNIEPRAAAALRPVASPRAAGALALAVALALALALSGTVESAQAAPAAPTISWVRCYLPRTACGSDRRMVAPGGRIKIAGRELRDGMTVAFTRRPGRPRATARARLIAPNRLAAVVPATAASGRIRVRAGRLGSNLAGPILVGRVDQVRRPARSATAFDAAGMWIWYVSQSAGGDPDALAAQARSHGIGTVFIKSGDGSRPWSQFSSALVQALKARGLQVCAWQYIYGTYPVAEAQVGAASAGLGADCLVIDAEGEYEGRYTQAANYLSQLRAAVGPSYPIGLAGFPYVDYHPAYPYSVFLGPNGAQFNLPQMYWRAIGTSVDNVFAHTYTYNSVFGRAVYPLGQLYQDPAPTDIVRFRALASAYGAPGVSWWDWQETTARGWAALTTPLALGIAAPSVRYPVLARGAKGDLVVWLQEHLVAAGHPVAVDGTFEVATADALRDFQASAGLAASGATDAPTWQRLLAFAPAVQAWADSSRPRAAGRMSGRTGPATSRLPAVRNELAARPNPSGPQRAVSLPPP